LSSWAFGYVEFRSAWKTNVLELDDRGLDRVSTTLEEHGLRVSSIGSPIGKIGVQDDFDGHLRLFDRALHVAEVLAAPYIRLFSFFLPPDDDPATHRDEVLRRMALRPYLEYMQIKHALFASGEMVPAGEGDGEIRETLRALHADGFTGFFSLEPHLATAGSFGGFSGPDLFSAAHQAFTGLLVAEGIEYR
jgi:sugar phosphate isomerase/epimerase